MGGNYFNICMLLLILQMDCHSLALGKLEVSVLRFEMDGRESLLKKGCISHHKRKHSHMNTLI